MAEHSTLLHQLRGDMTSGFDQLRSEMTGGFEHVNGRIDQLNGRIDQSNDRIYRLMLAVLAVGGGVIATLVALLITLINTGLGIWVLSAHMVTRSSRKVV